MKNYNFQLVYKKYNKKNEFIKMIILSIVFAIALTLVAGYFVGYRVYIVQGRSSEPAIHYGSIVIDYKVPLEELKVGDYVTFSYTGKSFVTHQIIEIDHSKDYILTSQTTYYNPDATPDSPIKYENVYGKVMFSIPYVGQIFNAVRGLVLTSYNKINILGIMTLVLTITAYFIFKKLIKTETYILKGH